MESKGKMGEGSAAVSKVIGEILHHEWDPIGVGDVPEARDEYSAYVGEVYQAVVSGASARGIAELLRSFEGETMGLTPREVDALMPVAERLLAAK